MSIKTLLGETTPDLITCRPSDELQVAVERMVENHLNAIAVMDTDGTLVGILTDHDVMRAIYQGKGRLADTQVYAWMTDKVVTCSPETKLTDALQLMGRHGIRHLVVTDLARPLAVVGIRKILAKIHEYDELEVKVLRDIAIAARASLAA